MNGSRIKDTEIKKSDTVNVRVSQLNNLFEITGKIVINQSRLAMFTRGIEDYLGLNHFENKELINLSKQVLVSGNENSTKLQNMVTEIRMVEISQLFDRYPRLVRELAKKSQSKIKLEIEGRDTKVDKIIIEEINEPLVHLIRNAVDHAAESEEERQKAGKSPEMSVRLTASKKGNFTFITIADDGKGLDLEKIKQKAIQVFYNYSKQLK